MLTDSHERRITYLRLAVTDRCNFRCLYCMPEEGMSWLPPETLLQDDEIVELLREVFLPLGIRKVRLTGGEPLLRRNLVDLVERISGLAGLLDLSATTNGVFLATHVRQLAKAGLDRINVSLDTLRPGRFKEITRGGDLAKVMRGIDAALAAGMRHVKVNAVVMQGINDDEVVDFAALTLDRPLHVRFIEMMPLGDPDFYSPERVVKAADIHARLADRYRLEPDPGRPDGPGTALTGSAGPAGPRMAGPGRSGNAGPAAVWRIPGAAGTVGFISPMSQTFCHDCNRVRLTADGQIKACLMRAREADLLGLLRSGVGAAKMQECVQEALLFKPLHHEWGQGEAQPRNMSRIGG